MTAAYFVLGVAKDASWLDAIAIRKKATKNRYHVNDDAHRV
jgi:hypothetical protein